MSGPLTPSERRIVLAAVMTTFFLVALDQTILAAAMPRIIADLHGLNRYGWLTTAYMLASTVMVPIYGKIADMFGRRIVLVVGISLFLVGSALCGLSGEFGAFGPALDGMNQLILFRAFQGLGGAALFTIAWVIVADLYPPLERGRIMGSLAAVYGAASVLGPVVGGFLTDHGGFTVGTHHVAGWRTVFYVNLPLGLAALAAILARMPAMGGGAKSRIDFVGALLIITTFVPLLLALTWGGHQYAWLSVPVVGLFVFSLTSAVALVLVERSVAEPMIPLTLFANPTIARCVAGGLIAGIYFLGYAMFLPLFMQVVQGRAATQSGLSMLPMTISFVASSVLSGQLVGRIGRPKPILIGGALAALVGVVLVLTIGPQTSSLSIGLRLILVGLGMGPAQNLLNLISQTAADRTQIGAVTALSQFSRQIGATVGVAVFSTVLTQSLAFELPRHAANVPSVSVIGLLNGDNAQATVMHGPAELSAKIQAAGLADSGQAPVQAAMIVAALRSAFAAAIPNVFKLSAVFVVLSLLVTFLIPDVVLKKPPAPAPAQREDERGEAATA